tara:strand:+ start:4663 stop:5040 length:378 start_codon:yes stop_codon:yes gene_type:complete
MTEEILQSAITGLKAKATERFAIIKDLYHRPATIETVDQITQHAIALAQLEGAMVTLQQYAPILAKQTDAEAESNLPEEATEVLVEEEPEQQAITEEQLATRSGTYRKAMNNEALKSRANEKDES